MSPVVKNGEHTIDDNFFGKDIIKRKNQYNHLEFSE
jgi:hypothetical protein